MAGHRDSQQCRPCSSVDPVPAAQQLLPRTHSLPSCSSQQRQRPHFFISAIHGTSTTCRPGAALLCLRLTLTAIPQSRHLQHSPLKLRMHLHQWSWSFFRDLLSLPHGTRPHPLCMVPTVLHPLCFQSQNYVGTLTECQVWLQAGHVVLPPLDGSFHVLP